MSDKRFTAQNMRDTAQILHYNHPSQLNCEAAAMLRQAADAEVELACLRDENIRLAAENARYAARLEAVIKIASESHISREVKHKGLRLYVCIDDFTTDLDMDEVVKSLNSIDSILRVARGEGGDQ